MHVYTCGVSHVTTEHGNMWGKHFGTYSLAAQMQGCMRLSQQCAVSAVHSQQVANALCAIACALACAALHAVVCAVVCAVTSCRPITCIAAAETCKHVWGPFQDSCWHHSSHSQMSFCVVDNSKRGITRGVISIQSHPLRAGTGTALIAVGTSSGTVAVLESMGRYIPHQSCSVSCCLVT